MKPSQYWKKELKGSDLKTFASEVQTLTVADLADLNRWAEEEMKAKGLPISDAA